MSVKLQALCRAFVIVVLVALAAGAVFGQECRVTTTIRLLDEHGTPVRDITPEQLTAEVGGHPAKIAAANQGSTPVTILMIDISSSMEDVWPKAVAAAKQISADAGDRVAVAVFRDQILAHASGREATNKLIDSLPSAKTSRGGTAIYDSVAAMASAATHPDTVLVIITDGGDNASHHSAEQTANSFLKNRWPPVFALVLDYTEPHTHREYFKKIPVTTGGVVLYPLSASKIPEAASELSADINSPLVVTLLMAEPITKPEKLKLAVLGPDGKPRHDIQIAHVADLAACDPTPAPPPNPSEAK